MKIAIILNGIAQKKGRFFREYWPSLKQAGFICDLFETQTKDDAVTIAADVATQSYDAILAAGGDGTLHQVVNGMLTAQAEPQHLPALSIIPIGSGNDFARTSGLTTPSQLTSLLTLNQPKYIDIGKIMCAGQDGTPCTRYFINEADIGMGPDVVKRVCASRQLFGASFAYYQAIIATFFDYKTFHVNATAPDWTWSGNVRTLVVANGQYYGHGLCIAPDANLSDRLFAVFIAGDVSVLDFIRCSGPLKKGKKISLPEVAYKQATQLNLSTDIPALIEADGELVGHLPAKVEVHARQIPFLM